MKNVMKKAHEITKKIIRKGDSYRATFRLALIFVYSQIKKGVHKMIELKGSEKQIKWASDIREELIKKIEEMKEVKLASIVGDKVKKSGKVLTESERKNVHTKRFDNAIESIKNETSSEFFINHFREVKNYNRAWDMEYSLNNCNIESLVKIASYWQGK